MWVYVSGMEYWMDNDCLDGFIGVGMMWVCVVDGVIVWMDVFSVDNNGLLILGVYMLVLIV